MTTEQTALQRLKEVCEAAQSGPWTADIRTGVYSVYPAGQKHNCLADVADEIAREAGRGEESQPGGYRYLTDEQQSNARFIATARTAMPMLIDYCKAFEELMACVHSVPYTSEAHKYESCKMAVEAARARLEDVCPK